METMTRSISVVIPNYNYGRFLEEAIESVLRQTVPAAEIIVVDDQVTVLLQENKGQRSAYNQGFQASSGDLILFLDSDDVLDSDAIASIGVHWRSKAAKLHWPLRLIDGAGNSIEGRVPFDQLPDGDVLPALLREGYYISPPASGNVYARTFVQGIFPLDETLKYGADLPPVYLAPFFGDIVAVNRPLGSYRIHGANHDAAAHVNAASIQAGLKADRERNDLLNAASTERGLTFDRTAIERQVHHLKLRLAAIRTEPTSVEYPSDTRWNVASRGIYAVFVNRSTRMAKKLFLAIWFLLVAAGPRELVAKLIDLGLSPSKRPRIAVRATSKPL
jgi:glycosyltransferase involved in cell wall biosynthesis